MLILVSSSFKAFTIWDQLIDVIGFKNHPVGMLQKEEHITLQADLKVLYLFIFLKGLH